MLPSMRYYSLGRRKDRASNASEPPDPLYLRRATGPMGRWASQSVARAHIYTYYDVGDRFYILGGLTPSSTRT